MGSKKPTSAAISLTDKLLLMQTAPLPPIPTPHRSIWLVTYGDGLHGLVEVIGTDVQQGCIVANALMRLAMREQQRLEAVVRCRACDGFPTDTLARA